MHRGAKTQMNASSLGLLFLTWSTISSANLLYDPPKNNPLDIDWYPAPSPEDGPPLSRGASRDKALLPAQIGGILGAYFFVVCIVGVGLILIGRKLRMSVQRAARALDIEMLDSKAHHNIDTTSPISPGANPTSPRNFSWPSPEQDTKNPYVFPNAEVSPITPPGINPYVDTRVVEADQEMMQRDLEDLYAHVMEQEDAKRAGASVKEMPPPPPLQRAPVPAEAPQRQASPNKKAEKARPSTLTFEEPKPKSHSRTSSIISSIKSPKRKGIRGMRISSPIPTPLSATFPGNASDEEPLTPRYYAPPPPPPIPKDQVPFQSHSRNTSTGESPTRSIASQLDPCSGPSRRPALSQISMASSPQGDPNSVISASSQTPRASLPSSPRSKFASQNPYAQHSNGNSNPSTSQVALPSPQSSNRALPLRQFEPALTSPSFMSQSTKTTVLERTTPVGGAGPRTGGLQTPWSAGAVPYSPYQPFTPMMPITPRLVTKAERKAKKKAEGRAPVLEMIKNEDELWDSAY